MKAILWKSLLGFLLVGALSAVIGRAQAQGTGDTWQIEVDIFSGRPNPVFTLAADELAQAKQRLGRTSIMAGQDPSVPSIRPSLLGYRGLIVRGSLPDKRVTSDLELFRGRILRREPAPRAMLNDTGVGLERFLVLLGEAKKAIPAEAMPEILKALP